jgi:hypothetical protein
MCSRQVRSQSRAAGDCRTHDNTSTRVTSTAKSPGIISRIRTYFLTGLVVAVTVSVDETSACFNREGCGRAAFAQRAASHKQIRTIETWR